MEEQLVTIDTTAQDVPQPEATQSAEATPTVDTSTKGNPFARFFARLGTGIKRYFTYNVEGRSPRAWELDVLRGVILLAVTLDHCLWFGSWEELMPTYTVVGMWLKELANTYCNSVVRVAMQPFGLWLLAFMSGMNSSFTRSSIRRVIKFWVFCGVFMASYSLLHIVWPDLVTGSFVWNIIAVLTVCFTIWWLLDVLKVSSWLRGYLGALLIVVGITFYYLKLTGQQAYVENGFLSLMVYSTHGRELSPQNFEPLLPHLGFFLVGGVVGKYLYPDRKSKCKSPYPPKALTPVLLIGKHSLAAYLCLPFVILGIIRGIVAIVGACVG